MTTIRGIYLDIKESDYSVTMQGITFFFSSKYYLEKFTNKVLEYVAIETAKLYIKYGIKINLDIYFMIVYYKKIEKRGFRIYDENKKQEITDNVEFINTLIKY